MATHAKESATPRINPDRLTGEAGAHPIATGIGAVGAAALGLTIAAAVGSSLGGAVALAGGAFIGGYIGKAIGELIVPTDEAALWHDDHPHQDFAREETLTADHTPCWRAGYHFVTSALAFLVRHLRCPPSDTHRRTPSQKRRPDPQTRTPTNKRALLALSANPRPELPHRRA